MDPGISTEDVTMTGISHLLPHWTRYEPILFYGWLAIGLPTRKPPETSVNRNQR